MWPELAIIAASMFAKNMNEQGAIDRTKSLQNAMAQYQASKARDSEAAINNLVAQQSPAKRQQEMQDITASRAATMNQTVDEARAASPVTAAAGTNTSGDYQRASSAAADLVASRKARTIQALALMGAPGEAGVQSGIRFGRAAGTVDANNQAINNVGVGYGRDIDNVSVDPMLGLLSNAGMAVGTSMLGKSIGDMAANTAAAKAVNNGQGFTDASDNLYDDSVTNLQDAAIQRKLALKRALGQMSSTP